MLAKELVENCPFWNKDLQKMECTIRMTNDLVLIWQPPAPDKIGLIELPDSVKGWNKPTLAVVVSVGPGYTDNKKFNPTFLRPGWVVIFDYMVPKSWRMTVNTKQGVPHECRYLGEKDVRLLVEPETEIESIGTLISLEGWRNIKHMETTRKMSVDDMKPPSFDNL